MVQGYQRVDRVLRAASLGSLGWSVAGCRGAQAGGWLIGWFVCGEANTQCTAGNNLATNAELIFNKGGMRFAASVCVQNTKQNSIPNKKKVLTKNQNHDRIIPFPLCPSFFFFPRSFNVYISSQTLVPLKARYTKLKVKAIFIQPSSSDSRYVNWICKCH